ncbi:MAG: hypothetical protein HC796_00975 [Synechococcaceae cyanobacterium RL_1_2]|nr:hypothetical protein [Synechococcaceae cyanobacterium RL_1_2]
MASATLKLAQSNLELSLLQATADSFTSNEIYVWLVDIDVPKEIANKLHELITYTKKIGKKVFNIGKIVLIKIIEFVKAHPHLVAGIGIGLSIGLAVQTLVNAIPFIGPVLSPLAGALTCILGITILGLAGHRLDKKAQEKQVSNNFMGMAEDIVEIAKEFFTFIADIFNTIFAEVITA